LSLKNCYEAILVKYKRASKTLFFVFPLLILNTSNLLPQNHS